MKFEGLIEFNSWDFIFSMVTFLVLFLVLKHFLFEKVHSFMEKRTEEVEESLKNAEKTGKLADEKLASYEEKISDLSIESRRIIKRARDEAKVQAEAIISDANEQAHKAIKHSQDEIEREKFNARKELQEEIGNLAVMAAKQILQKEISEVEHRELVDKVIREAEENQWN